MTGSSNPNRRKLIEVALPLTEISIASRADKDRKIGTIKNIHKWFAPMPTPALRALIFSALVDDPEDEQERKALIELVKALVPPDGGLPKQSVLEAARKQIRACNPELPTIADVFAGGGSTLVEAQRLGLPVFGSDLNPVAALISRTLAELLPPMSRGNPVGAPRAALACQPYDAFADDLRYYGGLVQEAVESRLGWMYPKSDEGETIAWLWARTAPCVNPACGLNVPLFSSPWLSKQRNNEASLEAVAEGRRIRLVIHTGSDKRAHSTKASGRASFLCPACGTTLGEQELRRAGMAGRFGLKLMAVCLDTGTGRRFVSADEVSAVPSDLPYPDDLNDLEIAGNTKNFSPPLYGLTHQSDLYTVRQLAVLAAFADEVARVSDLVVADGGSKEWAVAITSALGLCTGKLAQSNSTLVRWRIDSRNGSPKAEPAFGSQAIPMLWDFAECNPFGQSVGSWHSQLVAFVSALKRLPVDHTAAKVVQADARVSAEGLGRGTAILVTDPPYFGQINYADLSDYFYFWLRRALANVHPDLFQTLATPKAAELVANPARHGGSKEAARRYFIEGFTDVFSSIQRVIRSDLPIVVVYAHKQNEETIDGVISTGWESLLEAVLAARLRLVGTWPIEAASRTRQIGQGTNALSSYVILVCRPRDESIRTIDRRGFISALKEDLPDRLRELQQGNVAPLDVQQAAIGPGMEIFSRFSSVTEPNGSKMTVRTALAYINQALDQVLSDQEGDFDNDTRWCVRWFEEHAWAQGEYRHAEQLANSRNTSMEGLERAGIIRKPGGKVWLVSPEDLPQDYDPGKDDQATTWEAALHLLRLLETKGIDRAGGFLRELRLVFPDVGAAKELSYVLFNICERRNWATTALRFNNLVTEWPNLLQAEYRATHSSATAIRDIFRP